MFIAGRALLYILYYYRETTDVKFCKNLQNKNVLVAFNMELFAKHFSQARHLLQKRLIFYFEH